MTPAALPTEAITVAMGVSMGCRDSIYSSHSRNSLNTTDMGWQKTQHTVGDETQGTNMTKTYHHSNTSEDIRPRLASGVHYCSWFRDALEKQVDGEVAGVDVHDTIIRTLTARMKSERPADEAAWNLKWVMGCLCRSNEKAKKFLAWASFTHTCPEDIKRELGLLLDTKTFVRTALTEIGRVAFKTCAIKALGGKQHLSHASIRAAAHRVVGLVDPPDTPEGEANEGHILEFEKQIVDAINDANGILKDVVYPPLPPTAAAADSSGHRQQPRQPRLLSRRNRVTPVRPNDATTKSTARGHHNRVTPVWPNDAPTTRAAQGLYNNGVTPVWPNDATTKSTARGHHNREAPWWLTDEYKSAYIHTTNQPGNWKPVATADQTVTPVRPNDATTKSTARGHHNRVTPVRPNDATTKSTARGHHNRHASTDARPQTMVTKFATNLGRMIQRRIVTARRPTVLERAKTHVEHLHSRLCKQLSSQTTTVVQGDSSNPYVKLAHSVLNSDTTKLKNELEELTQTSRVEWWVLKEAFLTKMKHAKSTNLTTKAAAKAVEKRLLKFLDILWNIGEGRDQVPPPRPYCSIFWNMTLLCAYAARGAGCPEETKVCRRLVDERKSISECLVEFTSGVEMLEKQWKAAEDIWKLRARTLAGILHGIGTFGYSKCMSLSDIECNNYYATYLGDQERFVKETSRANAFLNGDQSMAIDVPELDPELKPAFEKMLLASDPETELSKIAESMKGALDSYVKQSRDLQAWAKRLAETKKEDENETKYVCLLPTVAESDWYL